jgi:hypothetical protein
MRNRHLESCTVATMTWITVTQCQCHKWSRTCSVCRNHKPILSSFMTYHLVCTMSNTTDVTCGAGTSYTSGTPGLALGFNGIRVGRLLVFCVMYCRSLFVLLSFFFWSLYCLSFSYLPSYRARKKEVHLIICFTKLKPNPSAASS